MIRTRRPPRAALLAVCVIVVIAASAAPRPALAQSLPGGVAMVSRPDGSVARAIEWTEAVLTHTPGSSDDAVARIGAWPQGALSGLLVEAASIRRLMRDPATKVFPVPVELDGGKPKEIRYSGAEVKALAAAALRAWTAGPSEGDFAARAIVLHTDIALLGDGSGVILHYADGAQIDLAVGRADHWAAARAMVDTIPPRLGREADLALWFRATLAKMAADQRWNGAQAERAVDRFGGDAGVHYLAGCLHEVMASARTQAALARTRVPPGLTLRVGSADDELDRAVSLLARAVALDAGNAEARLHYGRVLTLVGRSERAVRELRRVAAEVAGPVQKYYAQLFLGAALATARQPAAARAAYEAAAALFPGAQAPRLGLSELAFSSGNRSDAAAAIAPLLAPPAGDQASPDPWWTYPTACGRDATPLLDEARRRLSTPRPAAR